MEETEDEVIIYDFTTEAPIVEEVVEISPVVQDELVAIPDEVSQQIEELTLALEQTGVSEELTSQVAQAAVMQADEAYQEAKSAWDTAQEQAAELDTISGDLSTLQAQADATKVTADKAAADLIKAQQDLAAAMETAEAAIKTSTNEYALSTSETVAPTTGWSSTSPTRTAGSFIWLRTAVTRGDGTTSVSSPVLLTGNTGAIGTASPIVTLKATSQVLTQPNTGGATNPATTTVTGSATGTTISTWEYSVDGAAYSTTVPAGVSRSSNVVTITGATMVARTIGIRAIGEVATAVDTLTVARVVDGKAGDAGGTTYTVILTNEANVFPASSSGAAVAGSTTSTVVTYSGQTRAVATVGTVSGLPAGMTYAVSSNGTTSPVITFTVTPTLTTKSGSVNVPVTVDGVTFNKVFSYALAIAGTDGAAGRGITSATTQYQQSSSGTTAPTGTWADNPPPATPGQYVWTRTITAYTDSTSTTAYSVGRIGSDGNPGDDGVGIASASVTYQLSASGSTAPSGAWLTSVPTTTASLPFLWTRTVVTYTDSSTSTAHSVSQRGSDGTPGAAGRGITSAATQYQQSASGTTAPTGPWVSNPPSATPGQYVWARTITTYTDSTSTTAYSVGRIGSDGNPGDDGVGIASSTVTYQLATSGSTAPSGEWLSAVPTTTVSQPFLWTRTVVAYTDSTSSTAYSVSKRGDDGTPGAAGRGITSATTQYQQSSSGTTAPSGTWADTPPTPVPGQYVWTRTITTYTDSTSTTAYSVGRIGSDGNPGDDGVGITSASVTYQLSASGSTAPSGAWLTTVPTTTASLPFLWTRTVVAYSDSTSSTAYSVSQRGSDGTPGAAGRGITSATTQYQQSSSGITAPSGSWTDAPPTPVQGQYVWTRTVTAYTDSTSTTAYSVGRIGSDGNPGDDGKGITSSTVTYQLATSGSTAPSGAWLTTVPTTTASQPFLWTRTITSYTDSTSSTVYSVSQRGSDGTPGAAGRGITSATTQYQQSSSGTAAPTGTWVSNPPLATPGQYVWTRTITTYTDSTSTTAYSVGRIGSDGNPGDDGVGIASALVTYQLATSGSTAPTGTWSSTVPTATASQPFLWTRTVTSYTDSSTSTAYSVSKRGDDGTPGAAGRGITSATIQYQQSSSGITAPTGTWADTPPTPVQGQYVWTRTLTTYTDSTSTTAYSVGRIGSDGTPGNDGKGITSSVVAYQLATSGSTAPSGAWLTTVPTTTASQPFLWTRTVTSYTDSTSSTVYSVSQRGSDGTPGAAGRGITSAATQYQQSSSGTTAPTGTWVDTPPTPVQGQYVWTRTVTTYTDSTSTTAYSVGRIGSDGNPGDDGVGIASASVTYQVGNSGTTAPAGTWSSTVPASTASLPFLWTRTVVTYTDSTSSTAYSVSKRGDDAPVITLTGTTQVLMQASTGTEATTPATAVITGTATNTTISSWMYSVNGGTFSATVPAGVSRSGNVVTITGSSMTATSIAVQMGNGTVSDTMSVTRIVKPADGTSGADAYTVVLTNEAITFPGSTTAALAGTATSSVLAYKGATAQTVTVGSITGQVSGLTTTVTSNGTTAPIITLTVTTSLTATSGNLTVPLTVDGKSFTKIISWSVARTGTAGVSVSSITPYYAQQTSTTAPAVPPDNPPASPPWYATEPPYVAGTYLFRTDRVVYSNGTFAYTPVNRVSSYDAAAAASLKAKQDAVIEAKKNSDIAAANALRALSDVNTLTAQASTLDGRVTIGAREPVTADGTGKSVGSIWAYKNAGGSIEGRWVWNGTSWDKVTVTNDLIGPNAVGRAQIAEAAIGSAQIAEAAITDAKVGNMSVGKLIATLGAKFPLAVIDTLVGDDAFISRLTAERLSIGNFNNLIPNGDLSRQNSKIPWKPELTYSTSDYPSGYTASLILPTTGTVAYPNGTDSWVSVAPDSKYVFEVWLKGTASTNSSLAISLTNQKDANAILYKMDPEGSSDSGGGASVPLISVSGVPTTWTKYTRVILLNSDTTKVRVGSFVVNSGVTNPSSLRMTGFRLRPISDSTLVDPDLLTSLSQSITDATDEVAQSVSDLSTSIADTLVPKLATKEDLASEVAGLNTSLSNTEDSLASSINTNKQLIDDFRAEYSDWKSSLDLYVQADANGIIIGNRAGSDQFKVHITNTRMSFYEGDKEVAFISNQQLVISQANLLNNLAMGSSTQGYFNWTPNTQNGNLSLKFLKASGA